MDSTQTFNYSREYFNKMNYISNMVIDFIDTISLIRKKTNKQCYLNGLEIVKLFRYV